MKHFFLVQLLVLILIGNAFSGLKTGERELVESYGDSTIKSGPGDGVFVGVSEFCPNEGNARYKAALDARLQILMSLDLKIETNIIREQLEIEGISENLNYSNSYQSNTVACAKALISVQPDGFYIEKYRFRESKREYLTQYQAWCRMKYSIEEYRDFVDSVISGMPGYTSALIDSVEKQIKCDNLLEAIRTSNVVFEHFNFAEASFTGLSPEFETEKGLQRNRLKSLLSNISLLVVSEEWIEDEKIFPPVFATRLAGSLTSKCNFTVNTSAITESITLLSLLTDIDMQTQITRDNNAHLLLMVYIQVPEVEDTFGLYTASLNGQIKLVYPAGGQVLWESSIPDDATGRISGFADKPRKAALNALMMDKQGNQEQSASNFNKLVDEMLEKLR